LIKLINHNFLSHSHHHQVLSGDGIHEDHSRIWRNTIRPEITKHIQYKDQDQQEGSAPWSNVERLYQEKKERLEACHEFM